MSTNFRRHYPWLIALAAALLLFTLVLGEARVIAYTIKGETSVTTKNQSEPKSHNITNPIDLYDSSLVHSIQLLMPDADYQKMLTTYRTTGAKDWFQADVIIDGVTVSQVGVRLKGNASLRSALGRGMTGRGGQLAQPGAGIEAPFNRPPAEGLPPEGGMPQFNPRQPGGQRQLPGNLPDTAPVEPVPQQPLDSSVLSTDVKVPMLVKFDQFVEGQRYQGFSAVAIRSYGTSQDAAMLQEPLTNAVFKLMDQVAPRTAFAGVRINNQPERLYTLAEQINGTYLETYFPDTEGILYKAEMGADFRYLGEDQSAYTRLYDQKTLVNGADRTPLIAFTRFLSQASDEEFERELDQHLNVDGFATYLAINNLLVNSDSLADMGNNFYLYYNNATARFDLLFWDGNESLGKIGRGAQSAQYNLYYETLSSMGARVKNNVLKQRFLANASFRKLYEDKLRLVYQQAFASGWLETRVKAFSDLVTSANTQRSLVSQPAYDLAVRQVLIFIQQRAAFVASSDLLK